MASNEVVEAEVVQADDEATQGTLGDRAAVDVRSRIGGLNNPDAAFWSSIKGDDFSGRKKIAAALASSTPLMDHLHEEIPLVDIIVQNVQIEDENTHEVSDAPRVTLIDANGNAYNATSVGVLSSVEQFVAVVGEPSTWPEPLVVKAVEERGRRGWRYLTLKMV